MLAGFGKWMNKSIIISCAVTGFCVCVYLRLRFVLPWQEITKLIKAGRVLDWSEALDRTRQGGGFFVIKADQLWWIAGAKIDCSVELCAITEARGRLVRSRPKGNLSELLKAQA